MLYAISATLASTMARTADPAVRAALIDAAAARLAEGGADALSIRGVAADVGASSMAVYTHFGSKDDLLLAVVQESFRRLAAELGGVPVTDDPLHDLGAVADAYRHNAHRNANLYRVMFERNPLHLTSPVGRDGDPTGTDARVEPSDIAIGLEAFGFVEAAVARCIDAGLLPGDPAVVALQLWATAHGAVSLELAGFLGDDGETVYRAATAAVVAGLPDPAPSPKTR